MYRNPYFMPFVRFIKHYKGVLCLMYYMYRKLNFITWCSCQCGTINNLFAKHIKFQQCFLGGCFYFVYRIAIVNDGAVCKNAKEMFVCRERGITSCFINEI